MISVTEAKQIISENCGLLKPVCVALQDASGKILAENIQSPLDIPGFKQSSMDGYAINFSGYETNEPLTIVGEIAAGNHPEHIIKQSEAVRIFTGAVLPEGTDTVVMQEKVLVDKHVLIVQDAALIRGANVRQKGAEIRAGDLALEAGSLINPAAIGFLAGLGISNIFVYPSPKVSIIVTGNELQKPGLPLEKGKVYESNSYALRSALESVGIRQINIIEAEDNLATLTGVLSDCLLQSDLLLLTGGVSVGDYDFVVRAAENCGIQQLFHRIKQRPGKPLYFGKKEDKIVFGLPGNPSSVLTCFYQYVVLAIQQMNSRQNFLQQVKAPLETTYKKVPGLTHFLKGNYKNGLATVLTAQESFRMSSFAKSNCLIEIEESVDEAEKGSLVTVYLLPGY